MEAVKRVSQAVARPNTMDGGDEGPEASDEQLERPWLGGVRPIILGNHPLRSVVGVHLPQCNEPDLA